MRRRVLLNGSGGTDFSKKYLTFKALEAGTFTFTGNAIEYSVDNGNTWTTLASGTATPSIAAGSKILWKASGFTPNSSIGIGTFSSTQQFDVEGNIMSLYYGDDYANQRSLSGKIYAFSRLFKNSKVVDARGLILPATTLPESCCRNMFDGCKSLTTAPELPATTVGSYCHYNMFYGCTSLTTAPELPATTLARDCYNRMFSGCTSLTTAPELPATTLAMECYSNMFYGCTSLTTAPELPATTLVNYCYDSMFRGCKSLTTAPALPATTLAKSCYYQMFLGCTNLTSAPELPATTLVESCYYQMFGRCTSLSSIKCLATNISASNCTSNWVMNIAASGTFIKAASMSNWTTGYNGIPSGWTVRNHAEPVVLYPEDYDTPVSGYIGSNGRWTKATSSGRQSWVFHDITNYQGGTCNLYLGSVTGYYAFVKEIPTAVGSVQYASGWSNRATLSQDAIGIQIPSDAVYLCFYYHGSTGNMYPSKVEIYPDA